MKFNLTAHKELWNWLADNPDKGKYDWPRWKRNGGQYNYFDSGCFACHYANNFECPCNCCPLLWGKINNRNIWCCDSKSLYAKWSDFPLIDNPMDTNFQIKSNLARQIANLPVREGVECE